MIQRVRRAFRTTALGPAMVLWGFGYVLVDIFAALLGRSAPGLNLLSNLPLFVLGVTYTVLLDRLRRRLGTAPLPLRLAVLGVTIFAVTAVHTLTDLYWLRWLALTVLPDWQSWALNIGKQRIFTVGLLYLWTFCLAITLLWATRVGETARRNAARALAFEAASHRAEAAALRLQLNPHFLFNALNSISSLVTLDRKEEAEEMIGELSDFLRSSLIADPTADVPLGDELATIESYLNIESARFGSRMNVQLDIDDALLEAAVPNFILQPLVENAIKHGVAASRAVTTITIGARRDGDTLLLSVTNRADGPANDDPQVRPTSTGIGLANIRQRLAIGYGTDASLDTERLSDGHRATIRIPLERPAAS